jgi:hypothetical protein
MSQRPAREPPPTNPTFDAWIHTDCPFVVPEPVELDDPWRHRETVMTLAAVVSMVALAAAMVTAVLCAIAADPHAMGETSDMEDIWLLCVELAAFSQVAWRRMISDTNAARGLSRQADSIGRLSNHARALGGRVGRPVNLLWAQTMFWGVTTVCSVMVLPAFDTENPDPPEAISVLAWALVVASCALRGCIIIRYMQLEWLVRRSLPGGSQRPVSPSV